MLITHVLISVGLFGDSAGFLAVSIRAALTDDPSAAKLMLIVSVIGVGAIVINPALTAVMSGASHGTTPLIAASGYDVLALGVAAGLGLAKPGGAFRRRTTP